jgi:large subunit ribosomal protein L30e
MKMDNKAVAAVIKVAMKSGKVVLGERASLRTLKTSKLVVISNSLRSEELEAVRQACKDAEVPLVVFEDSAVTLGAAAGRSFPVKVLSIKSAGDADVGKLLSSGAPEALAEQKA